MERLNLEDEHLVRSKRADDRFYSFVDPQKKSDSIRFRSKKKSRDKTVLYKVKKIALLYLKIE